MCASISWSPLLFVDLGIVNSIVFIKRARVRCRVRARPDGDFDYLPDFATMSLRLSRHIRVRSPSHSS